MIISIGWTRSIESRTFLLYYLIHQVIDWSFWSYIPFYYSILLFCIRASIKYLSVEGWPRLAPRVTGQSFPFKFDGLPVHTNMEHLDSTQVSIACELVSRYSFPCLGLYHRFSRSGPTSMATVLLPGTVRCSFNDFRVGFWPSIPMSTPSFPSQDVPLAIDHLLKSHQSK